jgi:hypothetical protein
MADGGSMPQWKGLFDWRCVLSFLHRAACPASPLAYLPWDGSQPLADVCGGRNRCFALNTGEVRLQYEVSGWNTGD